MKRFVICPVTFNPATSTNEIAVDIPGVYPKSIVPTNETNGLPLYHFALAVCAASNAGVLQVISNTYVFPDYPLDGRMDGMGADARAALVQSVQAYDFDGQGKHLDASHTDADSYRDLITRIGQQIDPAFYMPTFDVAEGQL